MASLTNPVKPANIVDRFADYVRARANADIVWGTNALPFPQFPSSYFGGTTSGRALAISGDSIAKAGDVIKASDIYNVLVAETRRFTSIRNLRARRNITGNSSSGVNYDETRKAHLSTSYLQEVSNVHNRGVASGQVISSSNMESFFNELRNHYTNLSGNTLTVTVDVCHASCHSSCHSSRGRR